MKEALQAPGIQLLLFMFASALLWRLYLYIEKHQRVKKWQKIFDWLDESHPEMEEEAKEVVAYHYACTLGRVHRPEYFIGYKNTELNSRVPYKEIISEYLNYLDSCKQK